MPDTPPPSTRAVSATATIRDVLAARGGSPVERMLLVIHTLRTERDKDARAGLLLTAAALYEELSPAEKQEVMRLGAQIPNWTLAELNGLMRNLRMILDASPNFDEALLERYMRGEDIEYLESLLGAVHQAEAADALRMQRLQYRDRPWMLALDAQFEALATVEQTLANVRAGQRQGAVRVPPALLWSFETDAKLLRTGEAYAWEPDPTRAALAAATSIPHDSMLLRETTPGNVGWWHFAEPLAILATSERVPVTALLWGWGMGSPKLYGDELTRPRLTFSCYVRHQGALIPTSMFRWFEGETFHDMIARSSDEYDQALADVSAATRVFQFTTSLSKAESMRVVAELGLLFLAGCTWLGQRVLLTGDGHVERHRRKQLTREHRLDRAPSVKVVHLRRVQAERREPVEGDASSEKHFHVRWVVDGHWRNQPHGRGRALRKLKWIDPFPKGDPNDPLVVPKRKVYKVDR